MPAGLDGNPEPIVTPARSAVIRAVASAVVRLDGPRPMVAVDGRSGSGKSTFADELERALVGAGRTVVRSTIDSFHRPRVERLARGETSAVGYYEDSHQIDLVVDDLLDPFRSGARALTVAVFDEPGDRPDHRRMTDVPADAVLVFDGLFLHRPELRRWWDLSVLVEADRRCDQRWLAYLEDGLPDDPTRRAAELDRRLARARWPRYRDGWRHYVEVVGPASMATYRLVNDDLGAPELIGPTGS